MIVSKNLCFTYTKPEETSESISFEKYSAALTDININIKQGEFIAILGRNGSGKSTLARQLNALLTPTEGTLWVKGLDTADSDNTWRVRQSLGMVFQNPDNQLIASIVEDDVAFGPENLGIPTEEIRRRVDDTLRTVGMREYALDAPQFLSGGQKQRIAIAGVLAMKPDCIVLDEPTAMLDPSGRREVLETVKALNRGSGITIILITHYMEEAATASRVLVMDGGKLVMDGTPKEIFRRADEMKALGLDVPPVTALANRLIEMGVPVSDSILTVEDFLNDGFIQTLMAGA
ncbi:MAG: energy-coupling factor transporter ATPase [Clostridiales bacterium]|jgi:energy-coupling factor transporter ATPase|nr:energy-coupling factor transporter ATPase [Clostridiales bacterium]